jgi:hypothetical protein
MGVTFLVEMFLAAFSAGYEENAVAVLANPWRREAVARLSRIRQAP